MITINNKEYPYKFGMSVLKRVGKHYGLNTINDVVNRYSGKNYENLSIEDLDDVSVLVLYAIERGCEVTSSKCDIGSDDILDALFEDPISFGEMMDAFAESLGANEGNLKAPKTGQKQKKSVSVS